MAEFAQHQRQHLPGGFAQPQFDHLRPKGTLTPTSRPQAGTQERPEVAQVQAVFQRFQPESKPTSMAHGQVHQASAQAMAAISPFAPMRIDSGNEARSMYLWESTPNKNESAIGSGGLPNKSLIIPTQEHRLFQPGGFVNGYPAIRQDLSDQDRFEVGATSSLVPASIGFSQNHRHFARSDVNTDFSSTSPRSYFNEFSGYDQLFDGMNADQDSPSTTWPESEATSCPYLERIPSYDTIASSLDLDANQPQLEQRAMHKDLSGLPYDVLTTPLKQNYTYDWQGTRGRAFNSAAWSSNVWAGRVPQYHTTIAHSGNLVPWLPPNQSLHSTAVTYPDIPESRDIVDSDALYNIEPIHDSVQNDSNEQVTSNSSILTRHGVQATEATTVQRKKEDQILLEGKRAGLTYKEIRRKMHTKVAESTLRGRYRSLTKARRDRVRKPVWTENDVRLLRKIVRSELRGLDDVCYRHSTQAQRLAKLSWKRVAEYIAESGGSYHFGNSTCKKKWAEIEARH